MTRRTSRRRRSVRRTSRGLRRNSHRLTDLRAQARDYALANAPGFGKEILRVWSNPLLTDATATKHVLTLLALPDFDALPWNIRRSVIQILADTGFPEEALTMRHRRPGDVSLRRNSTRYTTRTPVRPELRVDEHSSEAEILHAWRIGRLGIKTAERILIARPDVFRQLRILAQNSKDPMTRKTSRRRSSHPLRRNTSRRRPERMDFDAMALEISLSDAPAAVRQKRLAELRKRAAQHLGRKTLRRNGVVQPLYGYDSASNAYVVEDYPYSFKLRTKIRYWLELGAGKKGFRFVSQTVNPKTGAWNKPKASTYADFAAAMYLDEKGHVQWTGLGMYSDADKVSAFLRDFPGADKIFLKQIIPMKVRASQKFVELNERGETGWTVNGVPTKLTASEAERNIRELAQWQEAAAAL